MYNKRDQGLGALWSAIGFVVGVGTTILYYWLEVPFFRYMAMGWGVLVLICMLGEAAWALSTFRSQNDNQPNPSGDSPGRDVSKS